MQEKKANRSFPRPPKWLLFVPLGLLALYVTVQLVAVLDNRYETETAIQDTLADSVELDGVLLFAQQPVDGELAEQLLHTDHCGWKMPGEEG